MNTQLLDQAKSVRQGEELDTQKVDAWLKQHITHLTGEPSVTQYAGGASNWTYCLDYPQQSLILRRAPKGTKAKGAHDMGREYKLQHALKPVYSYVPRMEAFCDDESILGTDFYVMEKLTGIIPRKNLPRDLTVTPERTKQLCENVLDCLVELHKVDYKHANLSHLGKGEGYTQRQISGWSERFTKAKTWNVPSGKKVIKWLENNMPSHERICITHNDFRFDNVVLDANDYTKVLGILDWELATLGDPLMDLGNTLAYWVEPGDDFLAQATRHQPTHLKGMLTRKEVVAYYCKKMDITVDDFTFYEVYGLFRLAGIVQQIYYRYHHGQTKNPAFKNFWVFVHYLLWRCNKAIKNQGKA
ncbi:phosphotransferase family protein [Pseudoalteromonas sp. SWN29]|uniref:phosphotransferase family protein n=1 Tax=Pseudoalteromonas sp. SWN29 TaxID=2792064 RepID=UPI0018CDBE65|nr:phosphotransferase family protein [Pseudoalteromonas sp. SWN29]MBH0029174.1 phosphotransferase family protein [Pseudoalteromonas sp. SWN29]